eukprot:gene896-biopygen21212
MVLVCPGSELAGHGFGAPRHRVGRTLFWCAQRRNVCHADGWLHPVAAHSSVWQVAALPSACPCCAPTQLHCQPPAPVPLRFASLHA